MLFKGLILAAIAVCAAANCEDQASNRSRDPEGYTCGTVSDGFCLACPIGESTRTNYGTDGITCTCSGSGDECSVFKDGEPSSMEAYIAATSTPGGGINI